MHICIHAVVDFLQQVTKIIREVIAAEWLVSRCRNNCFSKYIRALVHLFDQFDLNTSSCSKSPRRSCRREYIGRRLCNLSAMIRFQDQKYTLEVAKIMCDGVLEQNDFMALALRFHGQLHRRVAQASRQFCLACFLSVPH